MRNMHRLLATLSTVAVMNAAFGTPTAFSDDRKAFPGFACIRDSGGTVDINTDGGIFNVSNTLSTALVCPIVRDNTTESWTILRVTVIDQNLNADVRCRGVSSSRDLATVYLTPPMLSSGNASTGQNLIMSGILEGSGGPFSVRCTIPPVGVAASGITSYEITEPTPTDTNN